MNNKIRTLALLGLLAGGIGTADVAHAQAPGGFGMAPQMGRQQIGPQQGARFGGFGMMPQAARPQGPQAGPQAARPQGQQGRQGFGRGAQQGPSNCRACWSFSMIFSTV